jgi:hypothetical protein
MELSTSLTKTEHGEIGAKASGFCTTLTQFKVLLCLKVCIIVFQPAELARKFLQTHNNSVAAALTAIGHLQLHIENLRSDIEFDTLFAECTAFISNLSQQGNSAKILVASPSTGQWRSNRPLGYGPRYVQNALF